MKAFNQLCSTGILFVCLLAALPFYAQNNGYIEKWVSEKDREGLEKVEVQLFSESTLSGRNATYFNAENEAVLLDLNRGALQDLVSAGLDKFTLVLPSSQWRKNSEPIVIDLYRSNIISEGAVGRSSDPNFSVDLESLGVHYWGKLRNERSLVSFSFFDDYVGGFIATEHGNYSVDKSNELFSGKYLFYKNRMEEEPFICATPDNESERGYEPRNSNRSTTSTLDMPIELYLESNTPLYLSVGGGSVIQTTAFMLTMFNHGAILYANEEVIIKISETFVETADPTAYPGPGMLQYLPQFQLHRGGTGYNGDYAHLFVSSSTQAAGNAGTRDDFCNNSTASNRMSVSLAASLDPNLIMPNYQKHVKGFVHELGHKFGSPHTRACFWNGNNTALDYCGSNACYQGPNEEQVPFTIMSSGCDDSDYFDLNFIRGFGVQPGDHIRTRIAANSNCFVPVNDKVCQLTSLYIFHRIEDETPVDYVAFYKAIDITADNSILNNSEATYQAENSITLLPGFTVDATSTFQSVIAPCNDAEEKSVDASIKTNNLAHNPRVAIYPNPTSGGIEIKSEVRIESYTVLNLYGRTMGSVSNVKQFNHSYDSSVLPSGLYFIKFKLNDGNIVTKRLIKN